MVGDRIISAIDALRRPSVGVEESATGRARTFRITAPRYRLEIVVDPERWLGLEFEMPGDKNGQGVSYDIDTDLYKISRPEHASFGTEIEDDIVQFIESLASGRIKVGRRRGRNAMIVPAGDGYVLVVKGRLATSRSHYDRIGDAELGGSFVPFDPS